MHHYSTDQPISVKKQDRFQRYEFAKRIAETIANRNSEDGIVIGIYGPWGDGKTSVLNFIEGELKIKECLPVRFNPWRYKGEDELLKQFFETLARELKTELLTRNEKKGVRLKKFTPFAKSIKIPFVDVGDLLNNIGDALSSLGIEMLKDRISGILQSEQKKVVVFIDDIDRLDKDEIHAIFRLVKLNADFKNTTYILSFDENMVAAAIGNRFGKGNIESGRDFLEKIIQVRLTLPKIQRDALRSFQFELINRTIDENGLDINEKNASRFIQEFDHLLLRLKTPRQAAQYVNSISFSVPLLLGEVDLSDLLLIEGLKIFYPKHYEFIKNSPEYFIEGYGHDYHGGGKQDEKIKRLNEHLDILGKELNYRERQAVKGLLIELFPRLKEVFDNWSFPDNWYTKWYKNKQIASPQYFERYFSYGVIKGQLSDIAFDELRRRLLKLNTADLSGEIQNLIHESSDSSFIDKVRVFEDEYSWDEGCALIRALISNGELLPGRSKDRLTFLFETSRGQAQKFIYTFFKNQRQYSANKRLAFAKEILQTAKPYEFRFQILEEIGTRVSAQMVFDFNEVKELHACYRQMTLERTKGKPIYIEFPHEFFRIAEHWGEIDQESLKNYVVNTLNEDSKNVIFFLKSFTGFLLSSSNPEGYYVDFSREYFSELRKNFDLDFIKDFIQKKILELYTQQVIDEAEVVWVGRDNIQTDINIARQLIYWCNKIESDVSVSSVAPNTQEFP